MDARRLRFGLMLAVALVVVGLSLALGLSGGGERADAQTSTTPTTATTPTTRTTTLPANPPTCTATTLGGARTANVALASDCDTLLAIKSTLAGTGWPPPRSLNWAPGTAITRWNGVTVGGTPKRVTRLRLLGKGLAGAIPTQLGNLTALTDLNLSWNRLTGAIPTQVGSLAKLTALRLNGNRLTGTIPTELGNLAKLRTLALSGNTLTGCVPNALWSVATRDIAFLRLSSCTAPTRLPRWQAVGAGTYYFDDYPTSHTGTRLVITVDTGRQIRWASTLYTTGDGEPGDVWFILVDVSSGKEFGYNAYNGEAHNGILRLPTGAAGLADTMSIDAFFDRITNSARMEDGP